MTSKKIFSFLFSLVGLFLFVSPAFAHVVVQPNQVDITSLQTFIIAVPSEKDTPTVALKLLIPSGLKTVMPHVKPGWDISVIKNGDTITEIDWTNGNIPPEQRDVFYFSATAPTTATTIKWKAYQTYADGSVVSWDQDPILAKKGDETTPYSITHVVTDLPVTPVASQQEEEHTSKKADVAIILSVIAILVGSVAVSLARRQLPFVEKKKK